MLLYRYDKNTKKYLGCIGEPQIDPLESKIQGRVIRLIPPFCTFKEPKPVFEGQVNIFNENLGDWEVATEVFKEVVSKVEEKTESTKKSLQEQKIEKIQEIKACYEKVKGEGIKINKVAYSEACREIIERAIKKAEDIGVIVLDIPNSDDVVTLTLEEASSLSESDELELEPELLVLLLFSIYPYSASEPKQD